MARLPNETIKILERKPLEGGGSLWQMQEGYKQVCAERDRMRQNETLFSLFYQIVAVDVFYRLDVGAVGATPTLP